MRPFPAAMAVVFMTLPLLSCTSDGERASRKEPKTSVERASYALGMDFGLSLRRMETEIDVASLLQGVEDSLEDREPLLTSQEMSQVIAEFKEKAQQIAAEKRRTLSQRNLKETEAFLEENRSKEDVVTTASGLQYRVLRQGDGPKPKAADRVTVHYRGTLIDGTEFDSSYERGEPATFAVERVIPGWTEVLQLMPVGSQYQVFIPPNLGYGERGAGPVIGPNATLIFEVELLRIEE